MYGKNPIRPPVHSDGSSLEVVEIFATLQGEGPFVGTPSVFIRLGGCNLACHFCDTEFEQFSTMVLTDILVQIEALAAYEEKRVRHLVVITGGEPLRQPIVPLCEELLARGFEVQIETNGTIWRELPEAVHIVCSPKATNGSYFPLRPDVLTRANALKFIISAEEEPYRTVPEIGQSHYDIPVYVQPMDVADEKHNASNRAYALELAMMHGYRLSLQTHKLLQIR